MLNLRKLALGGLVAAGALLGGCSDYGYGYGGVNLGYGAPGYYDDYAYGYGPAYGYGYGGWYDGFYYPGTGYYVYDRSRRRSRWNEGQRRYWEGRREARRGDLPRGVRRDGNVVRDYQRYRADREARQGQPPVAGTPARPDREAWSAQRQARQEAWRAQRAENPGATARGWRGDGNAVRSWRNEAGARGMRGGGSRGRGRPQ